MSWSWRYLNSAGDEVDSSALPRLSFPAQADAETWIGEEWPGLLESGVDAVVLLEDAREVYGPMSLHPPE